MICSIWFIACWWNIES